MPVGVDGLHREFIFNGAIAVDGAARRIRRVRMERTPGVMRGGKRQERKERSVSYYDSEGEFHPTPEV